MENLNNPNPNELFEEAFKVALKIYDESDFSGAFGSSEDVVHSLGSLVDTLGEMMGSDEYQKIDKNIQYREELLSEALCNLAEALSKVWDPAYKSIIDQIHKVALKMSGELERERRSEEHTSELQSH